MFEFLTLRPNCFGLDISDLSIKIARLKKKRRFFSLTSYGEFSIKPGIIEKGEIKDKDALIRIIRDSVQKIKGKRIETDYVIASLPEEQAFLQVIEMPRLEEQELKEAVKYEAENYIPFPVEEVYLDFQVVGPASGNQDSLDVLIGALPKNTVDSYVEVIKKAGLKPFVLEIESQATARALIKKHQTSNPILIVDFGATRTSFIVFSGSSLRSTLSIPVCGNVFTEIIVKKLGVSFEDAEKIKIKYGLDRVEDVNIKNGAGKKIKKGKIFEILTPCLTDLVEQIKKYLSYYRTHAKDGHLSPGNAIVKKILLCGGGATMKRFPEFLESEFKIPVELGNPWTNILPEPLKEIPGISFEESLKYTTSLGLALRGTNFKK